jgi:hypothetical protein
LIGDSPISLDVHGIVGQNLSSRGSQNKCGTMLGQKRALCFQAGDTFAHCAEVAPFSPVALLKRETLIAYLEYGHIYRDIVMRLELPACSRTPELVLSKRKAQLL